MNQYKIIFFFMFGSIIINAQTDWQRWEAKQVLYELPSPSVKDYTIDQSSFGMTTLSLLRNTYYFFISDLDGDNCSFIPSCSKFFMDAVKETNILKGSLMFADRFTRDINIFKGSGHYHLTETVKYFDPEYNYTLNLQKIKF